MDSSAGVCELLGVEREALPANMQEQRRPTNQTMTALTNQMPQKTKIRKVKGGGCRNGRGLVIKGEEGGRKCRAYHETRIMWGGLTNLGCKEGACSITHSRMSSCVEKRDQKGRTIDSR